MLKEKVQFYKRQYVYSNQQPFYFSAFFNCIHVFFFAKNTSNDQFQGTEYNSQQCHILVKTHVLPTVALKSLYAVIRTHIHKVCSMTCSSLPVSLRQVGASV